MNKYFKLNGTITGWSYILRLLLVGIINSIFFQIGSEGAPIAYLFALPGIYFGYITTFKRMNAFYVDAKKQVNTYYGLGVLTLVSYLIGVFLSVSGSGFGYVFMIAAAGLSFYLIAWDFKLRFFDAPYTNGKIKE